MRLGRYVLAASLAVVLALIACEIGLRWRGYDPVGDLRRDRPIVIRRSDDAALGYELAPNTGGRVWNCDVRVSSIGLRDRERATPKPRGVRRVVVLGDSIAFGIGLAAEQTFPARLDAMLSTQRIEVLDLGVPGYDLPQEIAQLEQRASELEPDLVLVGYCVNDLGVHSLNLEYLETLERFDSPIYLSRVAQWWAKRASNAELVTWNERVNGDVEFARRFAGRIAPIDGDDELDTLRASVAQFCRSDSKTAAQHPFLPWYGSPSKIGRLRWSCERLAELAKSRGFAARVVFLPYPKSAELQGVYSSVRAIVAHECGRAGLGYLDPMTSLGDVDLARWRLSEGDGLHLNAIGHERLARELAPVCIAAFETKSAAVHSSASR